MRLVIATLRVRDHLGEWIWKSISGQARCFLRPECSCHYSTALGFGAGPYQLHDEAQELIELEGFVKEP